MKGFCHFLLLLLLASEARAVAPAMRVRFPSPTIQVEAGRTKMIAFQRSGTDLAPAELQPIVTPADQVEVVLPGKILDQQPVGYLRIRALKPGRATLKMGGASLALEITPETTPKLVLEPRIVAPLAGAAVWGQVAVTADCFVPDGTEATAVLRLANGTEVFPEPLAAVPKGPGRHFVFSVDTTRMSSGETDLNLEVVVKGSAPIAAEPVRVRVIAPKVEELIAGECEDTINTPRTEKYGLKTPVVGKDDSASSGACVRNTSPEPVWLTSIDIKEAGEYQMMVVARGDAAVGAYPTMTLRLDDLPKPVTNGRVSDHIWRRAPLGLPVHLDVGSHIVGVRFQNDFSNGKVDRNLYLDRYEFAKVSAGPAVAGEGDAPMMMMAPMMSDAATPVRVGASGFKVNFSSIFDGRSVAGPVTLKAQCRMDDPAATRFPEIGLWVNKTKVASESGPSLVYTIDPGMLNPGQNTVQLRSQDAVGAWVESAPQTLVLDGPKPPTTRRVEYFTMFDPGWDGEMAKRYEKEGKRLADSAAWFTNGESVLRLPETLTGNFQLSLLAKGQFYKVLPMAEVALRVNGKETAVLQSEIKPEWSEVRAGNFSLPTGPKELVVRFINDESDGRKNDRNFWLRAIKLTESTTPQKASVALKYWPQNQAAGLSDAVVAQFSAPDGLATADLVIDDIPQNLATDISDGLNPVLLPLLTRSLKPGSHRLQVVAFDADGKKTASTTKEIFVSAKREPATGNYAKAVALLDRLGFGASPADLLPLLTQGPAQWLASALAPDANQRAIVRSAINQRFAGEDASNNLVRQVLYEAVVDPNPVRDRFVLWTENHFSTWIEKTGREKKRREHEAFARIGVASFSDLLLTSAMSPAMLLYLDQQRSFAGRLNENYAREIMELHTLGVKGGYTQSDVTALAGLLTGWSMAEQGDLEGTGGDLVGEFRYDPDLNAGAPTQILGLEFPKAAPEERFARVEMALDMLASYPSTGEFISRKLAEHYVSDPAPASLVQKMGLVYLKTGGDMKALMTAMVQSPEFAAAPRRIATPLDFSLRMARAVRLEETSPIADFLRRSGMGLFDHSTPDGYSAADSDYVSSNALMQRWRLGQKIEGPLLSVIPKTWRDEKKLTPEQTQRMLDFTATRLLGACLSETSNQAAIELLAKTEPTGDARSRLIVNFLCQTPEAGLR
ncbi:MAG: DUF1800 family protein [Chthoniobacterales bacterium]